MDSELYRATGSNVPTDMSMKPGEKGLVVSQY